VLTGIARQRSKQERCPEVPQDTRDSAMSDTRYSEESRRVVLVSLPFMRRCQRRSFLKIEQHFPASGHWSSRKQTLCDLLRKNVFPPRGNWHGPSNVA
jgi:hypothetical protein